MIVPLLLALVQATSSDDVLVLHPPTPHVLVDVPDVPKLLDAYAAAPAMLLASDPVAREAFAKLEAKLELDMASSLAGALELLGLESGASTEDLARLARRARRVTLSYSTDELTRGELAADLARMREAQLEALDIEELLEASPEAALEESLRSDPWGRAYDVIRSPDGAVEAISRGSDGEPGGAGSATDISAEFDVVRWLDQEQERRRAFLLTIEFASEELARESWTAMRTSLGAEADPAMRSCSLMGANGTLERLRARRFEDNEGWSWHAGRLVVVSLGATTMETVQARASRGKPSFADEPSWRELQSLALPTDGATVARGALDTDWLAGMLSDAIDVFPIADNELEFVTARPTAFRMQLIDGRFHTDMVRPPSDESSWWGAFGNGVPSPSARASIPPDAAGAMLTQLDAAKLERQFVAWAGLDGAAAARLAEMEQKHGFELRRDVFGSLGTDVSMFVMPVNSIGLPNAVAVMELRDPKAFERGMQGLANAISETGGSALSIRASRYREAPMWSFEMERAEQGSLPFEISPTVVIVGSRAVLTTTTLFAKREIKRLAAEAATSAAPPPLPDMPAGATLVGSMDWPTMIASLYTSLRGAAALAGSFADLPIDLGALTAGLPDRPETFTRFFAKTQMSGAPLGERFHIHMESSFGPETWLALVGFATSAMRSIGAPDEPDAVSEAPEAGTAAESADGASLEKTRAALDRIGTRLLVYQIDRGAYPTALEELAQPSPNYPQGYLDGETLPVDGWGRAFAYRRSDDGSEYRVWSLGSDGLDGSGDEVVP